MTASFIAFCLLGLTLLSFLYGRRRVRRLVTGQALRLHSQPHYHGAVIAIWVLVPPLILWGMWSALSPLFLSYTTEQYLRALNTDPDQLAILLAQAKAVALGSLNGEFASDDIRAAAQYYAEQAAQMQCVFLILFFSMIAIGFALSARKIAVRFQARQMIERFAERLMLASSAVAIMTTIGIVLSLVFETARFFAAVPISEFIFGLHWSPQIAIRADQVAGSGAFGAIPLFAGTLMITFIAMLVAVPIGLFSAIYLSEYASARVRAVVKPLLEVLAGIPTVVYGFFAAITVAPFLRNSGAEIGLSLSSESALAAGLVMGIMIIPFVSSLSDDVINAVPQSLRDGASALGATSSETIRQVVLPAAFPGIVSAILLAVSRAIGETMIVVMAAGVAANLTANPLESVTTITVQIVMLLIGDQEFDSPKTLAAFALGMMLFVVTLMLNVVAIYVSRRYREQYD